MAKKSARRVSFMAQTPGGRESLFYSDLSTIGLAKKHNVPKATPAENVNILPKSNRNCGENRDFMMIHASGEFLICVHEQSPAGTCVTSYGFVKKRWHTGGYLRIPNDKLKDFSPSDIVLFVKFKETSEGERDIGNTIYENEFTSKGIVNTLKKLLGIE